MKYIQTILLLSVFVLLGCNNDKQTTSENAEADHDETKSHNEVIHLPKEQFDHAEMEMGSLQEKEFAKTISATGLIDVPPQSKAVISAFSGGYIKNTPLLVGDEVKKGERLVTIENPEFISMQQNYMETAEQLNFLKSEYERQKTLFEENITSQKKFLKAESEYKTAVARTNGLKKNLQMLNINPAAVRDGNIVSQVNVYSPINGYVTHVYVNTGTYVSPADQIMEIINTDHVHLELNVFEKDLLHIKKGQEIMFKVPEASEGYFEGEVHLVGTTIEAKNRMALIHGHIEEDDDINFSTGMFTEADIVTGTSTDLALPEDAVIELEGTDYVLLLEEEKENEYHFERLAVDVKDKYKGFVSFDSQLPADGKFLIKGGFSLLQVEGAGGHHH